MESLKHLSNDIIKKIHCKLLPDKSPIRYETFQELLNNHNNTIGKQYCLKCNANKCIHIFCVYATNYNILRTMGGLGGLPYST